MMLSFCYTAALIPTWALIKITFFLKWQQQPKPCHKILMSNNPIKWENTIYLPKNAHEDYSKSWEHLVLCLSLNIAYYSPNRSCKVIVVLQDEFEARTSSWHHSVIESQNILTQFMFAPFHWSMYRPMFSTSFYHYHLNQCALLMNDEELPLIQSLRSATASSPSFVQTHYSFRGRRAAHQPGRSLQLWTNAVELCTQYPLVFGSNDKYHSCYLELKSIVAVPFHFLWNFATPLYYKCVARRSISVILSLCNLVMSGLDTL